jgi:hypothetical protein
MGPWVGREGWSPLGKGTIWTKGIGGKVGTRAYAHNKCSIWSSSYSLQWNLHNRILISLCLTFPPLVGKRRHHWGKSKKRCQAATSSGFHTMRSKKNLNSSCTFHFKAIRTWEYNRSLGTQQKNFKGIQTRYPCLKLLEGGHGVWKDGVPYHPLRS